MKYALLTALLLIATPAFGQDHATDAASVILGGSIEFLTADGESLLSATPRGFVFVAPGFALGASLELVTDFDETDVAGGPNALYVFGKPDWKVRPFVNIGARFGEGFDWAVTPSAGGILFVNPHIGLTGELHFTHLAADGFDQDIFGTTIGVSAFIH